MTEILHYKIPYPPIVGYPLFLLFLVLVFYAGYLVLKRGLVRWAQSTKSEYDDIVVRVICKYYKYIAFLVILYIAGEAFQVTPELRLIIEKIVIAGLLIFALVLGANLIFHWLDRKGEAQPELSRISRPFKNLLRVIFFIVGLLLILDNLGFSLTALWTTLGIGSVAVALALKDTLANFFAGVYIVIDRPILPEDYVKLENGEEGYVEEIGWRSTRIRTLTNNIVVIPNARLSESIITNYNRPDPSLTITIPVTVSMKEEPSRVERILFDEVSRGLKEIEGAVKDFPPIVRFNPGIDEYGLSFKIFVRVRNFIDQYLVAHELRKRIFDRLKNEKIEIPYPVHTVYIKGEKDEHI